MKTKILMGMFAVLTALFTGCEALLPKPLVLMKETNPILGCEILIVAEEPPQDMALGETSPYGEGVELKLYLIVGDDSPTDYLPEGFTYAFFPVEYTYYGGKYWVKVLVNFDAREIVVTQSPYRPGVQEIDGEERIVTVVEDEESYRTFRLEGENLGYRWLRLSTSFPPSQLPGCDELPITNDGIIFVDCELTYPEGTTIPLRVGPGLDRAIFSHLAPNDIIRRVYVDGYHQTSDGKVWYRISSLGWEDLWVDSEDFGEQSCQLPLVNAPPVIVPSAPQRIATPTPILPFQDFAVYHCQHLGGNNFEWYSARVTYDANGNPLSEEITGGPFTGEWREGCPAGAVPLPNQQSILAPPTLPGVPPTVPPPPTSTPTLGPPP